MFDFRDDGCLQIIGNEAGVIYLDEEATAKVVGRCVKQYAKISVINRLKSLEDTDKEYPCFEGMSVEEILADAALVDSIAAGLVGAWDLDLAEDEHVDNEIAFWIKERSESK